MDTIADIIITAMVAEATKELKEVAAMVTVATHTQVDFITLTSQAQILHLSKSLHSSINKSETLRIINFFKFLIFHSN